MPLRALTRTSNGSYVLLNPDQVVAAYAVDEGTRVITTGNNEEGPVAFTVKETLEEVMERLKK